MTLFGYKNLANFFPKARSSPYFTKIKAYLILPVTKIALPFGGIFVGLDKMLQMIKTIDTLIKIIAIMD